MDSFLGGNDFSHCQSSQGRKGLALDSVLGDVGTPADFYWRHWLVPPMWQLSCLLWGDKKSFMLGFGSQHGHFFLLSSTELCSEWLRKQAVSTLTWDPLGVCRGESSFERVSGDDRTWPGEELCFSGIVKSPGDPLWNEMTVNPRGDRMNASHSHDRGCRFVNRILMK